MYLLNYKKVTSGRILLFGFTLSGSRTPSAKARACLPFHVGRGVLYLTVAWKLSYVVGYLWLILNKHERVHVLYTAYHVLECETNVHRAREELECILQETQHSWFDKTQVPCTRYAVYHEQRFEYCVCSPRSRHQLYRVTKLVLDLGWVDLVLTAPVAGGLQGQGSSKISDNSTQVRNLLGHPVDNLGFPVPFLFFFSVNQSVPEVGLVGLDVSVLLEQLEALLDGLQESKRYLFISSSVYFL